MSNKLNLIFDMNFQGYRWAYAIASRKEDFLSEDSEVDSLVSAILHSLSFDIDIYKHSLGDVFFVFDSSMPSFRQDILKGEYKATRVQRINSAGFKKAMLKVYSILENKFNVLRVDHFEADDLIFGMAMKFLESDQSSIIVSSDSDLRQLIKQKDGAFITVYDVFKKKYFINKYLAPPIKKVTSDEFGGMFDMGDLQPQPLDSLKDLINANCEFVDPCKSLLCKILAGDKKSDNIPSSFSYNKGKSVFSFTDLRADELYASNPTKYSDTEFVSSLATDSEIRRQLAIKMLSVVSCNDLQKLDEACNGIVRNISLIRLHESSYPEDVRTIFQDFVNEFEKNIKYFNFKTANINSLLVGTQYEYKRSASFDEKYKSKI